MTQKETLRAVVVILSAENYLLNLLLPTALWIFIVSINEMFSFHTFMVWFSSLC